MQMQEYAERLAQPIDAKRAALSRDEPDQLKHVIFADQFDRPLLERLCTLADTIRDLARDDTTARALSDLLRHRRAMLYFTQPSTRTFLSFTAACQILGITCNEVRDPALSSESKGESRFDSIRMFGSYFHIVIMRSPVARLAEACAYLMNDVEAQTGRGVPIVNAGSGADEHPTQALLDIYTVTRLFKTSGTGTPDGKSYAFCGDLGRGRTIKSFASLLTRYQDVTLHFIADTDPALRLDDGLRQRLTGAGVILFEHDSLDAIHQGAPLLSQVDCLYMTRIQKEHDQDASAADQRLNDEAMNRFKLTPARVAAMKPTAHILHPFPRDEAHGEIPTAIDADPRAAYFKQARNGMWARAALLAHLFGIEASIRAIQA